MGKTLTVKLKRGGTERPVELFYQVGDWAVTQGLCVAHLNRCYKVTHIPSTMCVPPCLHDLPLARKLARRVNAEIPKFKRAPQSQGELSKQFAAIFTDELKRHGARLELVKDDGTMLVSPPLQPTGQTKPAAIPNPVR